MPAVALEALTWSWEPGVAAPLAAAAALYALGFARLRGGAGRGPRVSPWQAAAFALGLVALVAALLSPLDELAAELFSAHMVQHELLILVAAPLCVIGRPLTVFLWALPGSWRDIVGHVPHRTGVDSAWHAATAPLAVWALHGAALWSWHLPSLYQAALVSESIHALEHACFFGTAVLFWWSLVHGRYGRFGYGVSVAYVFTTGLHSTVLGALLTLAPRVWYPAYAASTGQWGLTPLEDQQVAGLTMWVPSGIVLTVLGLALFAAWIGESERRVAYTQSERLSREVRP